ncbi:MAG: ZIP family metal transporter [Candidatus Omnitrophota bacterium]|nr:ZIP family metal transporter [Candidatus Omnitrophota bacterium]
MVLIWILASTILVSVISFVGVFTLFIKKRLLHEVLFYLIGFSAGALIGGAFLHLMPEALESAKGSISVFYYFILGTVIFFALERYLCWRHCHEDHCDVHAFTYLSLVGDGFHNLLDGLIIAVSYLVSTKLGIATTLAVIMHEIPQELGDFGVLIYGGFTKKKALLYNFFSALLAVVGALIGYILNDKVGSLSSVIVPVTAGGFVYIASSDLIPQIHKEKNLKNSSLAFLAFLLGIAFMALTRTFFAG